MAARRKNAKKAAPAKKGGGKKAKSAKPKKAKAAKEPKEVSPGPPVEVVMSIVTGIMMIAALVLVDYARGQNFGSGMMFSDNYEAPAVPGE
jgi:hypothetical protein